VLSETVGGDAQVAALLQQRGLRGDIVPADRAGPGLGIVQQIRPVGEDGSTEKP
jgi:hypothetical protein